MGKINLGSTIPAYPMPVSLVGTHVKGRCLVYNGQL